MSRPVSRSFSTASRVMAVASSSFTTARKASCQRTSGFRLTVLGSAGFSAWSSSVSAKAAGHHGVAVLDAGSGALPLRMVGQDVAAGNIRQLPPYDDLPVVNIYLITNPARRQSDAEAAFLSACEAGISAIGIEGRTYGAEGKGAAPAQKPVAQKAAAPALCLCQFG